MQSPRGLESPTSGCTQKKNDVRSEKHLRGLRAIALLSDLSEWNTSVLVELLHEEKEPIMWGRLHVGAEERVDCEHMQALMTNVLQWHWEWQEDHLTDLEPVFFSYKMAFTASLDLQSAFDLATPFVVSNIFLDKGQRIRGGSLAGRDEGRERQRLLQDLRDGVSSFKMHPAGRGGGSSALGTRGEICIVESR